MKLSKEDWKEANEVRGKKQKTEESDAMEEAKRMYEEQKELSILLNASKRLNRMSI